jgi:hypothetical protein
MRALVAVGDFLIFCGGALRGVFRRPWQVREFVQQAWFISSVSILPAALVSIPFGAVIALQLGSLARQLGAQSFTGATSVLAVVREAGPIVTALIIAPALRNLRTVVGVLQRNRTRLEAMLSSLAPFVTAFANVTGNGRWLDSYVDGLVQGFTPTAGGR